MTIFFKKTNNILSSLYNTTMKKLVKIHDKLFKNKDEIKRYHNLEIEMIKIMWFGIGFGFATIVILLIFGL